jgi:hypothetical protein
MVSDKMDARSEDAKVYVQVPRIWPLPRINPAFPGMLNSVISAGETEQVLQTEKQVRENHSLSASAKVLHLADEGKE